LKDKFIILFYIKLKVILNKKQRRKRTTTCRLISPIEFLLNGGIRICLGSGCWLFDTVYINSQVCYNNLNNLNNLPKSKLYNINIQIGVKICIPVVHDVLSEFSFVKIWDGCISSASIFILINFRNIFF
jgi:hypothetical protein